MDELNVLYTCSDSYAAPAGISMTSLFENNKNLDKITVFFVLDNVSNNNKQLLLDTAHKYDRNIQLLDAKNIIEKIKKLGISSYRGSHANNIRLFFTEYIPNDVEKLLYLDCDTLIIGSLDKLIHIDFNDKCIAMVLGSMGGKVKLNYDSRYNAGVFFVNVNEWKKNHITENLLYHIKNVRAEYPAADQDLLNIVCNNKVLTLPPEYNFSPIHQVYKNKIYYKYAPKGFYEPHLINNAKEHPVILHTYRFLGQFPWHKNTLHPNKKEFDFYLNQSLWANQYIKQNSNKSFIFSFERFLYVILPKTIFFSILSNFQYFFFEITEIKTRRNSHAGK